MRKGFLILAGCTVIFTQAFADTVTLTSGEKLQGKITSESPESVTMQYNVSESITDERILARDEIAKIEKPQADEILYEQLRGIKPDPTISFPEEQYDGMVAALNSFLGRYPASSHAAEMKENIEALKQEKERVGAGEVKYLGGWLNPDAAAARKVQIDGQRVLAALREKAAKGSVIEALNIFALLEKSYANTRSYPPAIEIARQLVSSLKKDVGQRQRDLTASEADFQKNFALTSVAEKPAILAARKLEQDQADAVLAASEKSQAKWKPLIPKSAKSLDVLDKATTAELTRLTALPVESMRASLDATDHARKAMDAKDFAAAEAALKIATAKWPASEAAQYWTVQLTKAKMPAVPAPSPKDTGPSPAPTVKPSATKAPEKTLATAPAAIPERSLQPASSASPTAPPKPKSTPIAPAPTPVPATSFFMTIPGALSIVGGILVLLGGVAVFNRMKAKRGEPE